MKEQENSPEEKLSEIEARNLPYIEYKVMIIRMLNRLEKHIKTIKKD